METHGRGHLIKVRVYLYVFNSSSSNLLVCTCVPVHTRRILHPGLTNRHLVSSA